jgi:tripartite-type tricarboxylate transporter receptor subunit TctC
MQDLAAGRIDYMCDVIATVLPQVKGNTVKAIAQRSGWTTGSSPVVTTVRASSR